MDEEPEGHSLRSRRSLIGCLGMSLIAALAIVALLSVAAWLALEVMDYLRHTRQP